MRKKKGGGEGGGREEVERGREVKKEGGKKEGVNIFNAFQKKVLLLIRAACLQCILDGSLT